MPNDLEIISEMPVELQLPPIKPGADWTWTFEKLDDNGVAENTTGYTFTMTGRDRVNGEVIFTLSIGNGVTHTAAQGRFDIALTDTQTAAIEVRSIVWDCFLITDTGLRLPPFQGIETPIEVKPRIDYQ